jgi:hypothetical protein
MLRKYQRRPAPGRERRRNIGTVPASPRTSRVKVPGSGVTAARVTVTSEEYTLGAGLGESRFMVARLSNPVGSDVTMGLPVGSRI